MSLAGRRAAADNYASSDGSSVGSGSGWNRGTWTDRSSDLSWSRCQWSVGFSWARHQWSSCLFWNTSGAAVSSGPDASGAVAFPGRDASEIVSWAGLQWSSGFFWTRCQWSNGFFWAGHFCSGDGCTRSGCLLKSSELFRTGCCLIGVCQHFSPPSALKGLY